MKQDRIAALDAIRGFAALIVAVHHIFDKAFSIHGYLAVDIFFLLSGFVIARAYEEKLDRGARVSWFFGVRMARLYPLYLFGLVMGFVVFGLRYGIGFGPWLSSLVGEAAFVPYTGPFGGMVGIELDYTLWTLPLELAANIVYAAWAFRLSNRALVRLAAVFGVALFGAILIGRGANIGFLVSPIHCLGGILRCGFGFTLGVLAYRWREAGRLPKTALSTDALIAFLLIALFAPTRGGASADLLLVFLVIPGLMLLIIGKPPMPRRYEAAATWVGRLSYPLYVCHPPIDDFSRHVLHRPLTVSADLATLAVALAVSLAAHLVIEPHGKRLVERVINRSARGDTLHPGRIRRPGDVAAEAVLTDPEPRRSAA